jgi:serine/threonine protein phosphatase PrpC
METEAHAHSIGSKAHANEDRYRILDARVPPVAESDRGFLYAVADGVGGAPKGMAAAQIVCDRLLDFYRRDDLPPTAEGLLTLLHEINTEIHALGTMPGSDRPVGAAAATIAWLRPGGLLELFHVGDTAAMLFDGQRVFPLTREHGVGRGLTNYFGAGDIMRVERIPVTACDEGDLLCLVTDGVTKVATPGHLIHAMTASPNAVIAARRVASLAQHLGSPDDITALVVEVLDWDIEEA